MDDVVIGKGKLAGKGLYAGRDFENGELVKSWNLMLLTQAEFDGLPESEHMFVHSFKGKLFLFPEPSRYTNHSANPTIYSDFEKQCDYALRPIQKGEPITINSNLEVRYELESFIAAYEKVAISNFKWLKGSYRNAVVSYILPNSNQKTLVLKRIRGNWHIIQER